MSRTHTCGWILADGSRCGEPTKYKRVRDDDGNERRQYSPWCPEHEAAARRDDEETPDDEK